MNDISKISLILVILLSVVVTSCQKDTPGMSVDEYIKAKNLNTTELKNGVHILYRTKTEGPKPTLDSKITAKYKGYLTNGDVFDKNDSLKLLLREFIPGWQIGLRDMSKGSDATLIVPSEMGYGKRNHRSIPANSTLVFDVVLLDF